MGPFRVWGVLLSVLLVGCSANQKFSFSVLGELEFALMGPGAEGQPEFKSVNVLDLGAQPYATTTKQTLYVRNVGDVEGKILGVRLDPPGLSKHVRLNRKCPDLLEGNGKNPCAIEMIYRPMTIGLITGGIAISYDDGKGHVSDVALGLRGDSKAIPYLRFEEEMAHLPDSKVGPGKYSTAIIQVRYNGTLAQGTGIVIPPAKCVKIAAPTDSRFTVDSAGTTCASDASGCTAQINDDCVIKVKFSPTTPDTEYAGILSLTYNNTDVSPTINERLQGWGREKVIPATLSVSPATLNLGDYKWGTAQVTGQVLISYDSSGTMPAENVTLSGPSVSDFVVDPDPSKTTCNLASRLITGSCKIGFKFSTSSRAVVSDALKLDYTSDGSARPQLSFTLQGQGRKPATLSVVSAQPYDFLSVPAFRQVSGAITLRNDGDLNVGTTALVGVSSDSSNFPLPSFSSCVNLAPGAACSMTAYFRPQTVGVIGVSPAGKVNVNYNDGVVPAGALNASIAVGVQGTGTSALVLQASGTGIAGSTPNYTLDFGNIRTDAANLSRTVTLNLYGTESITGMNLDPSTPLNLPFRFLGGGGFPGSGGTCGGAVAAGNGANCNFRIELDVAALAGLVNGGGATLGSVFSQTAKINYTTAAGGGSLNLSLRVTPRNPPALIFTVNPTDLGSVSVGNSKVVDFVVQNNAPAALSSNSSFHVSAITPQIGGTNGALFSFNSSGSCGSGNLAAGATCLLRIRFTPTSAGVKYGDLTAQYHNGISANQLSSTVAFQATGDANYSLIGSTSSLSLGNVYVGDAEKTATFTASAYGLGVWTPSWNVAGISPFVLDPGTCGSGPGECAFTVRYTPPSSGSAPGVITRTLTLSYSPKSTQGSDVSVTLSVTVGSRAANLQVAGSSFGKVRIGQSSERIFTVSNSPSASGAARNVNVAMPNGDFALISTTCAANGTLNPGDSCTIRIRFTPSVLGSVSQSLSVSFVDFQSGAASLALAGVGTGQVRVFSGAFNSCMINEVGQLVCWGRNSSGQLGIGSVSDYAVNTVTPVDFGSGVTEIHDVSIGASHICAVVSNALRSRALTCWGNNDSGKLGQGKSTSLLSPKASASDFHAVNLGGVAVQSVAAGFEHTCAVLTGGVLKCWGGNSSGQLGNVSASTIGSGAGDMASLPAVNVGSGLTVTKISAGAGHTCAVLSNQGVKCWGANFYGQLGQGVALAQIGKTPSDVSVLPVISLGTGFGAVEVVASPSAVTCVVNGATGTGFGQLKCFGQAADDPMQPGFFGTLGMCWARQSFSSDAYLCQSATYLTPTISVGHYSTDMGSRLPYVDLGSGQVSQVKLGYGFGCALMTDGSVRCWGMNQKNQLGNGTAVSVGENPASEMGSNLVWTLGAASGAVSLGVGQEHACAALTNNKVVCWGSGTDGANGNTSLTAQANPVEVYNGN